MPAHTPPAVVPTPATQFPFLRGRRVIVGVPGFGFRGDLRADDPVVQGSRTYVPILTEQDYYRAETDQIEVFAPLVPIDRVWVEQPAEPLGPPVAGRRPLDAPPTRDPMPAELADTVTGRRLVRGVPDGFVRDLRAVTEVYTDTYGKACVRVCGEAEWYQWAIRGVTPAGQEIPANALWIE
jgi:hypothetical protein